MSPKPSGTVGARGAHWLLGLLLALVVVPISAQERIPTPKEHFGFNIGDDYHLATYTQFTEYWKKLDAASDRMVVEEIGSTAEGRTQLMAVITSPQNHSRLAHFRNTARRLALAADVSETEARALAADGKAVVWIDGGLHATEVVGAHQLIETVYQLVSRQDAETTRILNDVIVVAVHANPDGMELVSNWYMREPEPTKRSTSGIPRLYHKYVGHDNNRDFFLAAQVETENMARIMFREWFPQIIYNHHQTGPAGTVLFAPPFRDPFNYNLDPLVPLTIEAVGAAMHGRFVAEGKPGSTMRSGASYSTWWNGGLRTTTYFHNQVGLLTEIIGNPTPMEIPLIPERQLASNDLPAPIAPQPWHFRQSIDYSVTANYAVLDYASRYRETLLYNIYLMGKNSIERGNRDHWTIHPRRIEALEAAGGTSAQAQSQGRRYAGLDASLYGTVLHDPAKRDPRGYIIPVEQPDFPTATKFVNALIKNGVTVHRATSDFTVAGKRYAKGAYVVQAAQAFRPHVIDMFEPQVHPNDFAYPGGPPIPPYDNAGWTLAFQMGVRFDRILDGFEGPFEEIDGFAEPMAGTVANANGAAGFLMSHATNDGFVATNRLLADGEEVYWLTEPYQSGGRTHPAGTVFIPAKSSTPARVATLANELGINFEGVSRRPAQSALKMRPVRVGLWDEYGGSMPSGWTRWLLEQYEFPFEVVYPKTLDEDDLADEYDVLVFVTGAIPDSDEGGGGEYGGYGGQPDPQSIPAEYRDHLGEVTVARTVPHLVEFMEQGGTVIAIGSSIALGSHAGLPVTDHLVDEDGQPLSREAYYIPGSVLDVRVDNSRPIAYGIPEQVDVFFNRSPVLRLLPGAEARNIHSVAWFDTDRPLRSGWAWGQERLKGGVAIAEAKIGNGSLYMFGPEILNRGQPHGSFKFFFNGIYLAGATLETLPTAAGGGK